MATKDQVRAKVEAAGIACEQALTEWRAAVEVLGATVSVNGFDIIHDRSAFRQQLQEAQARIAASLAAMEGVDWPTNDDYDQL